ncbi:MAG: hypothetical protein HY901_06635 [Deltaproteobacteria bacterium]|nr:hypothetical protein [Deltaproteobacteria bacterium]
MSRNWIVCLVLALTLVSSNAARAEEDWLSLRPTFLVGGSDVENNGFDTGFYLGTTLRAVEFWEGVSAEAEISLFAGNGYGHGYGYGREGLQLTDNSSYLRFSWRPSPWEQGEGLSLTILPLHANRLYLGYESDLMWQGTLNTRAASYSTTYGPYGRTISGAELKLARENWYGSLALKSLAMLNDKTHDAERQYTVLLSGGADLFSRLQVEVSGGYAEQGTNPSTSVLGASVAGRALAGRLIYHCGPVVGAPVDFSRYSSDPEGYEKLTRREPYFGGFSAAVIAEGLIFDQRGLASPDEDGRTVSQAGYAASVEARMKWDSLRAFLRGQSRSLTWLLQSVPSYPQFTGLPRETEISPEFGLTAGMDYHFERAGLTPGLIVGVGAPAWFMANDYGVPSGHGHRVLVKDLNTFISIPSSASVKPVYELKATLRWDVWKVSAVGEACYTHEGNRFEFRYDATGSKPVEVAPSIFGFNALIQARF